MGKRAIIHTERQRKRGHRAMKKTATQRIAEKTRKQSMSKKALREYNKQRRTLVTMNTGTQTHKSAKDYNRQAEKRALQREAQDA